MTTNLVKAALHTMYYTRLDTALAPVTQGMGAIFMLHHVLPESAEPFSPNRILRITPEFLGRVLEHVQERDFEIVSMDEAHARMASGKPGRKRFAAFTFDDGYRDNVEHALPIFEKYNAPMTVYVAPDFCDGKGQAWWLTLENIVKGSIEIRVPYAQGEKVFPLSTVAEKTAAMAEIFRWLRTKPDAEIHEHIALWCSAAGIDPLAACKDQVMNWAELRDFARSPLVTIGAHTMTHTSLAKCSEDEARWQIEASIEHIEHELGQRCEHFAYPYGDVASAGPREFEMARNAGVKTAVTTQKGLIAPNVGDQLTSLPRFALNGDFQDERLVQVLLNGAPFKMLQMARSAPHRQAA